jgi:hypothetical protein
MNEATSPKKIYQKTCAICQRPFETPYTRKELCSFECQKIAQLDRSRRGMRQKRHGLTGERIEFKRSCVACGFSETTDIHHEGNETYVLCPNHHALITRNIKTLDEVLQLINLRKEERRDNPRWPI